MDPNNQNNPNDQQPIHQMEGYNIPPEGVPISPITPTPLNSSSYSGNSSANKTKKILIALGGLVGVFIILIIIVVISSSGTKKPVQTDQQTATPESLIKEPTAIDIENINNSISDDITNMSADNDFPANNLTDEKLDL